MKHTPGPWKVEIHKTYPTDEPHYEIESARKLPVCTINDFSYQPAKANAKLIASTPDLLEALIDVISNSTDYHETDNGWECFWCGREYSAMMGDDEIPNYCPSDDCPGHKARKAIKKATA